MNESCFRCAAVLAAAVSLGSLAAAPARAAGTAFTYQGRLDDAGVPAGGLHDFRFLLFGTASGGVVIGTPVCADDVDVVDGIFTVSLDFGHAFAAPADYHVEVHVRRDAGLSCADLTGFTALMPRQPVTAAPMAVHANAAFALDAADGTPASAVYVDDSGNVGIGTTTPAAQLHVAGPLQWGGATGNQAWTGEDGSGLYFEQLGSSSATSRVRLQSSKASDLVNYGQFNIDPYLGFSFIGFGSGNSRVGIGTSTPQVALDVRGDIRLGTSGNLHAVSGEEKVRIIRGRVSSAGVVQYGTGFTASRTSTGTYIIGFNPPFPAGASPTMTVSAEWTLGTAYVAMTNGVLWTAGGVRITNGSGTLADQSFHFIAIGPR